MTTDLRAALRDAAGTLNTLARRSESSDRHPLVDPDEFYHAAKQYRAIADAPPTVAELLPLVDATHRVEFADGCGDERRIVRSETGGLSLLGCYGPGGEWLPSDLLIEDLHRPAKLVEVAP